MKAGCQTYSWEMQLKERPTTLFQMFDAVKTAGFEGVEFTNNTGGKWLQEPKRVREELCKRNLKLTAVTIARSGYTDPAERTADLEVINNALVFLKDFPGTFLTLTGAAHEDQNNWEKHLAEAVTLYNLAAAEAKKRGILCCIHPHSHHGSLLQTKMQYEYLFSNLEESVRWCPDVGHIVRGGQDLTTCLESYKKRIAYIHLKDVDTANEWQALGRGRIDFKRFFRWLKETDYEGWLVAEEESKLAWEDPLKANIQNREYLKNTFNV